MAFAHLKLVTLSPRAAESDPSLSKPVDVSNNVVLLLFSNAMFRRIVDAIKVVPDLVPSVSANVDQ